VDEIQQWGTVPVNLMVKNLEFGIVKRLLCVHNPVEWRTLFTPVRELLCSNPGRCKGYTDGDVLVFLSPSRQLHGFYLTQTIIPSFDILSN
jgi:hypothetical protein